MRQCAFMFRLVPRERVSSIINNKYYACSSLCRFSLLYDLFIFIFEVERGGGYKDKHNYFFFTHIASDGKYTSPTPLIMNASKDNSKDSLVDVFRPVLRGLSHSLTDSDQDKLLKFFQRNKITKLSGLSIFDPIVLWEKQAECDLLESETFCIDLGQICHCLSLDVVDTSHLTCHESIITEYYEELLHSEEDMDVDNLSPSCFDKLSYFTARIVLMRIFVSTCPIMLMTNAEARKSWLEKGALQLLKRYPLLSAEIYDCVPLFATQSYYWYPFFFFLYSGFGKDIVQQVHSYYPKVSRKGEETVRQFLRLGDIGNAAKLSFEVFKLMLELDPKLATTRGEDGWLLLEQLFSSGYSADVLEHVRAGLSKGVDKFDAGQNFRSEDHAWEFDICRTRVLERLVPQLRGFGFGPLLITVDASVHIFEFLCEQKKLEQFNTILPVDLVSENEEVKQAFELFIEKKGVQLKRLVFFGGQNVNARDRNLYPAQCATCLESISRSIPRAREDWYLEQLTLNSFEFNNNNAVEALFSRDNIGSLNFQLNDPSTSKQFAIPWDSSKKSDGLQVGQLNLFDLEITIQTWMALWRTISKLTRIEHILFAPFNKLHLLTSIAKPFEAMSMLPKLKTICIGPHAGDVSIAITKPLISILGHGCLEFLQIEGSHENHHDDTIGCHAYSIKVDSFCQALKDNKTLQFLFLRGVELQGTNVTKSFLDVLQKHNNTTIEFADICDEKHFYSIIPKDSWRRDIDHGFTYENYSHAWQMYFLTCFNRYGRGKVRDKSTTVDDLVNLLGEVHTGTGLDSNEEAFYPQILKTATTEHEGSPSEHLTLLYEKLRSSPESWYNVVKRDLEVLSLRFGLLRESPCLWCVHVGSHGGSGSGRKRKHPE